VDAFFDSVKVNVPEPKIRENRLHLLAALRATMHQIGDFSKIESSSSEAVGHKKGG
jgi:glycyl-tRNA synthetase beta chain